MRGSAALMARAAVAPAKPPPITTTRGAAWAKAGAAMWATGAAPSEARNCRRFKPSRAISASLSLDRRVPLGDGLRLRLRKALGDPAHDRARALPAFEGLHLTGHLGGAATAKPGDGRGNRSAQRMTPGTGAGARRRLGPPHRTGQQQHR